MAMAEYDFLELSFRLLKSSEMLARGKYDIQNVGTAFEKPEFCNLWNHKVATGKRLELLQRSGGRRVRQPPELLGKSEALRR